LRRTLLPAATAFFTVFAGSLVTATAQEPRENFPGPTATTVGPVTGTVSALNYGDGATVDGLLVGASTNVLLLFSKPVCGGVASLGKPGDSVTYSGVAVTFGSGIQTVQVTSYTDGSITYPPAAPPKPAAYPATPGKITQVNYSEFGTIDGFLFTPTSGPEVFVNIGTPSSALAAQLTVGQSVSVTGTLVPPPQCSPAGTVSEVDASSLTIGTTAYPISRYGMGWFSFGGFR